MDNKEHILTDDEVLKLKFILQDYNFNKLEKLLKKKLHYKIPLKNEIIGMSVLGVVTGLSTVLFLKLLYKD